MSSTSNWWTIIEQIVRKSGKTFEERKLQKDAVEKLQNLFKSFSLGSSVPPVLIRLPCGYGKTVIGEIPFIAQSKTKNWMTRGACYVLPTRALTKHHANGIKNHVHTVNPNASVRVFHGEEHTTHFFYSDFAVSTFDVFALAYARSSRAGHHLEFPAGTIATSYIVFDEAHMLQDEYAYSHTIMNKILRVLSLSGIPTIVMTATMPKPIEDIVFDGLEPVKIPNMEDAKSQKEIRNILMCENYRGKIMDVTLYEKELLNTINWRDLRGELVNKRVLIICNTVSTAQQVFEKIKNKLSDLSIPGKIILLHSRLEKCKRIEGEKLAKALMSKVECAGKCKKDDKFLPSFPIYLNLTTKDEEFEVFCESCGSDKKNLERIEYVIIVATQVVEAGLDITSDLLITECAPLDSLIQRMGRCARFGGEYGSVRIVYYPNVYRPYPKGLVKKAWKILSELSVKERAAKLTDFIDSTQLINENYEVLQLGALYEKNKLRSYLSYLEGTGFSTFTVDWHILKEIRVRPNISLTLVTSEEIWFQECERKTIDKGNHLTYKLTSDTRVLTYDKFLSRLSELEKERKLVSLDCDFISQHAFSIDYHYAVENHEAKVFLLHRVFDKNKLIELKLIGAEVEGRGWNYFYIVSPREGRISEGTYLLNPRFYHKELGLRVGEET